MTIHNQINPWNIIFWLPVVMSQQIIPETNKPELIIKKPDLGSDETSPQRKRAGAKTSQSFP
jgi:hypothetical protein